MRKYEGPEVKKIVGSRVQLSRKNMQMTRDFPFPAKIIRPTNSTPVKPVTSFHMPHGARCLLLGTLTDSRLRGKDGA